MQARLEDSLTEGRKEDPSSDGSCPSCPCREKLCICFIIRLEILVGLSSSLPSCWRRAESHYRNLFPPDSDTWGEREVVGKRALPSPRIICREPLVTGPYLSSTPIRDELDFRCIKNQPTNGDITMRKPHASCILFDLSGSSVYSAPPPPHTPAAGDEYQFPWILFLNL